MDTQREKVSYCIGLEAGKNLKMQFGDIDITLLNQGFLDALTEIPPKLAQEEIKSILQALKQEMEKQRQNYLLELSEENKRTGELFLQENKEKEGIVVLPSGLQYKVLKNGIGPSPHPFDVVATHYRASFIDGTVFESTYEQGRPQVFPLARVIAGWSEALQLMKVGDKWQLFVPTFMS